MNNEPVAYITKYDLERLPLYDCWVNGEKSKGSIPLYTQEQLEEARKLGMQQERALWNLAESTQEIMNTHPVKELTDKEIKSEAKYLCHGWYSENPERLVLFAKSILRKAQEKC